MYLSKSWVVTYFTINSCSFISISTLIHKPILSNSLKVKVKIYDSKYNFGIQSADIMSHYLHSKYEQYLATGKDITSTISFIEVKLFIP